MNDNAKALVAALRSGDFKQGTSTLTRIDTDTEGNETHYDCCLGVACKLAVEAGVIEPGERDGGGFYTTALRYVTPLSEPEGETAVLPQEVADWLGFATRGASLKLTDAQREKLHGRYTDDQLSGINDAGATFEQIADLIEEEPEGLFV